MSGMTLLLIPVPYPTIMIRQFIDTHYLKKYKPIGTTINVTETKISELLFIDIKEVGLIVYVLLYIFTAIVAFIIIIL